MLGNMRILDVFLYTTVYVVYVSCISSNMCAISNILHIVQIAFNIESTILKNACINIGTISRIQIN